MVGGASQHEQPTSNTCQRSGHMQNGEAPTPTPSYRDGHAIERKDRHAVYAIGAKAPQDDGTRVPTKSPRPTDSPTTNDGIPSTATVSTTSCLNDDNGDVPPSAHAEDGASGGEERHARGLESGIFNRPLTHSARPQRVSPRFRPAKTTTLPDRRRDRELRRLRYPENYCYATAEDSILRVSKPSVQGRGLVSRMGELAYAPTRDNATAWRHSVRRWAKYRAWRPPTPQDDVEGGDIWSDG
ncbi:hypothetical protein D9611_010040 [Ephemerocybe angulata]|uniref:Uncharacterized protein n=1 Tax=Ephemerocybe angulata TaxID=980116 RepID=A0A8H5C562_9AGAR|nr:hypothetical protein D9611_010040 [Tulosesus angulatus]